jgi:hypothetical protein
MVKLLEDELNLEEDTRVGLVRVILLVEDSPRYYSRYLPMLYTLVFEQTQELIAEANTNELDKVSRMRARTKIILATHYEEALNYFIKYQDYLACVISDVKFKRSGLVDDTAGISFLRYVHGRRAELPMILQSSDPQYSSAAVELKATFMNKNSETLLQDLKTFITYSLGYGHFVYRDTQGRKIAVARSMKDFENHLRTIPDESILYHALKNHCSWPEERFSLPALSTRSRPPISAVRKTSGNILSMLSRTTESTRIKERLSISMSRQSWIGAIL